MSHPICWDVSSLRAGLFNTVFCRAWNTAWHRKGSQKNHREEGKDRRREGREGKGKMERKWRKERREGEEGEREEKGRKGGRNQSNPYNPFWQLSRLVIP